MSVVRTDGVQRQNRGNGQDGGGGLQKVAECCRWDVQVGLTKFSRSTYLAETSTLMDNSESTFLSFFFFFFLLIPRLSSPCRLSDALSVHLVLAPLTLDPLSWALATAMGFAAAGALGLCNRLLPRADSHLPAASGLLLLCLSTTSLLAAASAPRLYHSNPKPPLSLPACLVNHNSCPTTSTALRLFHSNSQAWSATPHYSYYLAASYSAKGHRLNPEHNLYTYHPLRQPNDKPTDIKKCKQRESKRARPKSGQDAFFVSQVGDSGALAFGVADGVGGWSESGVDPADFAHGLCEYMACAARVFPGDSKPGPLHPKDLLQAGYNEVMQDKAVMGGGSTACVALADPNGLVEVAK